VYITEIKPGSPAARSALRPGDVILKWGQYVVDHRSLPTVVSLSPLNQATEVIIWRNKAEQRLAVLTEKMPE
jgi:S1-C subfamily serine protease